MAYSIEPGELEALQLSRRGIIRAMQDYGGIAPRTMAEFKEELQAVDELIAELESKFKSLEHGLESIGVYAA